jgi:UDP-N-acetylmuramoylalanine--D-glutamate ligase
VERDAVAGTSWRLDLSARRLRARFHLANMAAAAAAIEAAAGMDARALEAAWNSFPGVPHRLEDVGTVRGVRCVNDSIATNPDATIAALENIEGPVVLIAGGSDKGVPFGALGRVIARRVRALVTIGATAAAIEAAVREAGGTLPLRRAGSLEEAVDQAFALAQPGDTLLLSPACASYDMFRNFEQRGDLFRSLVRRHGDHADLGAHPARPA